MLLLPLFVACDEPDPPTWSWGNLACEYDPHDWYDTPTLTALHAEDGAFDFDPPMSTTTRRAGEMDFAAGTFSWDDTFADGFPYTALHADGTGDVGDDGDLSVSWTSSTLDVLDRVLASEVGLERTGCNESWHVFESGPDGDSTTGTTTTIVSDTEVDGTSHRAETDADITMAYIDHSDQSRNYTMDYTVGNWVYSGVGLDNGDSTGTRDWTAYDPEYDYAGHFDFLFDGSLDHAYQVSEKGVPVAEIEYHQAFDGSATGTWSYYLPATKEWLVCGYVFDDESCDIKCPGDAPLPC
jgi:hypothetical protein